MKSYYLLPAFLVLLGLALLGCSTGAPPASTPPPSNATSAPGQSNTPATTSVTRGGVLHVGLPADLSTMDPAMSTSFYDRQVYQSIFDPLLVLQKDLTIKPGLADKYDFSDPTTLVLTLHQGVKFQDGTALDAAAVKANFDRMMDPAVKSPRASEIASVKEVQVVDDHTVKLLLKQPDAALLAQLTDRAGMMVSPAAIQKYGKDLARNPVGTGPFQFVDWVKDDHLTVKKFDGYWQKGADGQSLPYLDQIIYKPVTDGTVRLTSLKTGTLDLIDGINPQDTAPMKAQKELVYDEVSGLGYQGLSLNNKMAPFDKPQVRQAMDYAVDREALAKDVLAGTVTPAEGPITPSSWAYDASINSIYTHDPNKSKELLQQAGLTLPVKFSCTITNTPVPIKIAQALKDELAQGGFDMQIEPLDFTAGLTKYNNRDFTCYQVGWSGRPDPDGNTYSFLHTGGGLNNDQYSNPQVDQSLEQARTVYDQAQRKGLYTQALKTAVADAAIIYLWWPLDQKAWTPKLHDFVHTPDGMIRLASAWLSK